MDCSVGSATSVVLLGSFCGSVSRGFEKRNKFFRSLAGTTRGIKRLFDEYDEDTLEGVW